MKKTESMTPLRAVRRSKKLSLLDAASLTGVSLNHLSQLERNISQPTVTTLYKIARAYKVHPFKLYPFNKTEA